LRETEAGQKATFAGASDPAVYALAALMGMVLRLIRGSAQWLVLRRHVRRARLWLRADALAWLSGGPW